MERATNWRETVEHLHQSGRPMLVRVHGVDDIINTDVRVGDELFLRDVTTEEVRFTVASPGNNDNSPESNAVVLPVTYKGKFEIYPYHPSDHIFGSVEDILAVYPFVSDFIYPLQTFTIEGVKIREYELLQVITTVQDLTSNVQLLEVRNVTKNTAHVLLPNDLTVCFQQWDDKCPLQEAAVARRIQPRMFSITHLSDYFCAKLHPMRVKLYSDHNYFESTTTVSPCKEPLLKKKFAAMFKAKEKRQITNDIVVEVPNINHKTFPSSWWGKPLTIDPIHTVHASNPTTGVKMRLPGELDMKIYPIDHERTSSANSSASESGSDSQFDDGYRTSSSSSESSFSLHSFDVSSLLNSKSRDDAVVAMVTGGQYVTSPQQNSLTLGTWVALHRARRVRKLLLRSEDDQKQHFLVSAQYSGEFTRSPEIYDFAGEVPVDEETAYVTRCSAYPARKDLDECRSGQFVWFHKQTVIELGNGPILVVHCTVADALDGPQHAVTFPVKLRGRFEKVTCLPSDLRSRDLFKQNLPISVQLKKPDSAIGYDPLAMKEKLVVVKIVSELTLIIEILKKSDKAIKSSETIMEIPLARSSLYVKEISSNSAHGIDPYPRRNDFKGLQKLPSVELLADKDVYVLDDAGSRHKTPLLLSPKHKKDAQREPTFHFPDPPASSEETSDYQCIDQQNDDEVALHSTSAVKDSTESAINSSPENPNSVPEIDLTYEVGEDVDPLSSFPAKLTLTDPTVEKDQLKPIPKPRKIHQELLNCKNVVNGHLPHTTAAPPTANGQPHSYALVRKLTSNRRGQAYSSPEYECLSFAS